MRKHADPPSLGFVPKHAGTGGASSIAAYSVRSSSLGSTSSSGSMPGVREQAPGLGLERHLPTLPGAPAQLHPAS
jgi:hypothetical protein